MQMPHNSAVVDVGWLVDNIDNPNLVILDATLAKVGQELPDSCGRIALPKARLFDLKNVFIDQSSELANTAPDPEAFQTACRELGINQNSVIVIYDHHGVYSSPRGWWLFRLMGHRHAYVLDGGLPAWRAVSQPVEPPVAYSEHVGDFTANYQSDWIANAETVRDAIGERDSVILDARPPARFLAENPEPRPGMRGGHIPGSKNLPMPTLIEQFKLLPGERLEQVFSEFVGDDQSVFCTCGSGITACVVALAAHVAGHQQIRVYDGSWAEWGANPDLPIE